MPNSTLTALPAASALDGTELYYSVQAAADTKVTGAQIKTWTSASPTLVTPTIGVAAGTSLALGGATIGGNAFAVTGTSLFNSAVTLGAAITYGGVTLSNSVTGTGSMVLSTSPTLVTPVLGVATGTSIALGGATLGGNAFAVTGTALFNSAVTYTAGTLPTASNQGTVSSGTFTPAAANSNYQFYTNNGAHTLAAPAADSAIDILVTNGASAGTITFSGFTVGSNTGDSLTTTNTSKFIISVRRINAVAAYQITALQ